MVDMKMGPTPTFFPPYTTTVDYEAGPPSSSQHLHSASVGDLSRYLNNSSTTTSPPSELGTYWPDFSSCRCDAYYLGGESAVTPTRGGNGSRSTQPPVVVHSPPAPASSRTMTSSSHHQRATNRPARPAHNNSSAAVVNVGGNGAGEVVPTSTSSNARGAQFTIIANVPYDTVRQDLVSEFRKFGRVELAMVVCDEASRHPHKEWTSTAGYAFVRFSKRSEAAAAIQAATMGLITIRGTRVRADWARKDSYAKRGRVSPAQGAPALNPHGIPDGITLLQDSLNRAAARNQWSMYGDISYAAGIDAAPPSSSSTTTNKQPLNHTGGPSADNWTTSNKATDVESPSLSNEQQVYQVLEDVIVALELMGPQKQTSPSSVYQNKSSNNEHLRRNNEQPTLTLPTHHNISSSDSSSFCNRLTIPGVVPVDRPTPHQGGGGTPQGAGGDEDTTASSSAGGVIPAASTQELASALSPASRGLLTVALSDVAARDAFTDVSPMAHQPVTNHARHHFNSPAELLHHTMQNISAAEAPPASAGPAATRSKAGPSGPGGALGASTASDFSSLSEIEDLACSEGSLTPPL